jgi:fatty acid desaturase
MASQPINSEIAALNAELRRRGFYHPTPLRILLAWAYNLALALGGLAGWWRADSWWLGGGALLISTVGMGGISTLAHTAAHGSGLSWHRVNELLAVFGFSFMLMVSINYWRHKHHKIHHPNPNVVGLDADCDLMPFFALSQADILSVGAARRFYYQHLQGWVFPLAVTLNGFNVQRAAWAHLITRLKYGRIRKFADWLDVFCLVAHIGIWIVLPCFLMSPADGILLYFLRISLLGHFMFFVFAPAHFPAEAQLFETKGQDFMKLQIQATVNFRAGFIGKIACNGLQYQIEHHLFPNISHIHYPHVALVVQDFCKRNGYHYRCFSWMEAIFKSYAAIFRPRPIIPNVDGRAPTNDLELPFPDSRVSSRRRSF